MVSSSPSKPPASSPTSAACAMSKFRSPNSSRPGSCASVRNSARSCGNFRQPCSSIPPCSKTFLALLPHDTESAAKLATRHDARLNNRDWPRTDHRRALRHALEIRHETFRDPAFITLLRKYKVALVCADTPEWPRLADVTADFVYVRLHGAESLYASGYGRKGDRPPGPHACKPGRTAARRTTSIASPQSPSARKRDVFTYFDNDIKVLAPRDAAALRARLGKPRRSAASSPASNIGRKSCP